MDALTQTLLSQLSGSALSKIGKRVGADEQTAGSALSAIMPVIVGALATNAAKPDGAAALHHALEEDHDGSILRDLGDFLEEPEEGEGAGILEHALGKKRPAVERGLAESTGLKGEQVGQLLEIAAPLVMGLLGQQQRTQKLDASGLAAMLGAEFEADRQSSPDVVSILTTALDADRDGSAVDEVVGFLGKLFRRR